MTGPWSGHIKYTEWVLCTYMYSSTMYYVQYIAITLLLQIKTTPDYYQSSPALLNPTRIKGCVIFQLSQSCTDDANKSIL